MDSIAFKTSIEYAAGLGASAVLPIDVNGDGNLDLLTANHFGGTVTLLTGTANGTFLAPIVVQAGSAQIALAARDLNGDGRADIVSADPGQNAVVVSLALPGGGFGSPTSYSTGNNTGPRSLALVDLNGDGLLDVVTGNAGTGSSTGISALYGLPGGSFGPATIFAAGGANPWPIGAGDFNGDGLTDVVTARDFVGILLGRTGGSFAGPIVYSVPQAGIVSLAIADMNGDGRSDIVTGDSGLHSVSVRLGSGTGVFGSAVSYSLGTASPYAIAVGDLNGDGTADVAVASIGDSTVRVLLNTNGLLEEAGSFHVGASPAGIAIVDVNADGFMDLVTANLDGQTVSVLIRDPAAPVITSDGGGDAATVIMYENNAWVTRATATDSDSQQVTWAISGGADAAKFAIDAASGRLSFLTAPDFEQPGDADQNNRYEVSITASDSTGGSDTQQLSIAVHNVTGEMVIDALPVASDNRPFGTSPGLPLTFDDSYGHGWKVVIGGFMAIFSADTVVDADPNGNSTFSASFDGHFTLYTFGEVPGEMVPVATGSMPPFVYHSASMAIDPVISQGDGKYILQIHAGVFGEFVEELDKLVYNGSDEANQFEISNMNIDSELNGGGGNDSLWGHYFNSNDIAGGAGDDHIEGRGILDILDGGPGNDYVSDSDQMGFAIASPDLLYGGDGDDFLFSVLGADSLYGGDGADQLQGSTDANLLVGGSGDDALNGYLGEDTAEFSGSRSQYSITVGAPNGYEYTVTGPDGVDYLAGIEKLKFSDGTVNIGEPLDHAPVIVSDGGEDTAALTVPENTTAVTSVVAADGVPGHSVTFAIVGGADGGSFTIDQTSGALTFASAPDFEAPADSDGNNVYEVVVQASDADGAFDRQTISVTVTDADEAPTGVTLSNATVLENSPAGTVVGNLAATDVDAGETFTFVIASDPSGLFALNGTSLVIAAGADVDFEAAASHVVTVRATDSGGLWFEKAITIAVADVQGVSIIGTSAANVIDAATSPAGQPRPTNENDTIDGRAGNDVIAALGGNDTILGGAGNDTIDAGAGNDVIDAGAGTDTVLGGTGDDIIVVRGTEATLDAVDAGEGGEVSGDTLRVDGVQQVSLSAFDSLTNGIENWQGNGLGLVGTGAANGFDLRGLQAVAGLAFIDAGSGDDVIFGSAFADDLRGGAGNDALSGEGGDDHLEGGAGNDTIAGGGGDDTVVIRGSDGLGDIIDAGGQVAGDRLLVLGAASAVLAVFGPANGIEIFEGNGLALLGANVTTQGDAFDFSALTATSGLPWVDGRAGDDVIVGSNFADDLRGGAGDDTLSGGLGSDIISGDAGKDIVSGGAGDDVIVIRGGEAVGDSIDGGESGETVGDTILVAGTLAVTLSNFNATASGIEHWHGNGQAVNGTAGADALDLSGLLTVINLPYVSGGAGGDVLVGSGGADDLRGGAGSDSIVGGDGNDIIAGGADADNLDGGEGDDIFVVTGAADALGDSLQGGAGTDTLRIDGSVAAQLAGFNAAASSIEVLLGNSRQLVGTAAADAFDFSGLSVMTGVAYVDAGNGNDSIRGSDLAAGDDLRGGSGVDTIRAGAGDDKVNGGNDADLLYGDAGDDTIVGGGGADQLVGGAGHDILTGGADADWFIVAGPDATSSDIVTDFARGSDKVAIHAADFGLLPGLSPTVTASTNGSAVGQAAQFVFNTTSRTLSFDADGALSGGAVLVATFTSNLRTLDATDFLLLV